MADGVNQERSEVMSLVASLIYPEQQLTDYLWWSVLIRWPRATNKRHGVEETVCDDVIDCFLYS